MAVVDVGAVLCAGVVASLAGAAPLLAFSSDLGFGGFWLYPDSVVDFVAARPGAANAAISTSATGSAKSRARREERLPRAAARAARGLLEVLTSIQVMGTSRLLLEVFAGRLRPRVRRNLRFAGEVRWVTNKCTPQPYKLLRTAMNVRPSSHLHSLSEGALMKACPEYLLVELANTRLWDLVDERELIG